MAALSLVVGLTASLFLFAFGAAAIFAAVYCYYHKAQAPPSSFAPRRKQRSGRLGADTSASADLEKGGGAAAAAGCGPPIASAKVCDEDGVRRYGWSEIRRLTGDFTSAVVGQGGFSTVYVAQLPGGSAVAAVKVHRERTDRLRMAFRQELDVLMRVGRHDRIVRLLGYCDVGDEGEGAGEDEEEGGGGDGGGVKAAGALVLEYVPNGTLHEALHGVVGEGQQVLDWGTRMCVAYELASAIEYLHECCDPQVVHCDIKPSNVLLDEQGSCKLCDFGSAKTGFSSTVGPPPPSTQQQHQYLMPLASPPSVVPHPSSTSPSPNHKDSDNNNDYSYYHQRRRQQTRPLVGSPGYVDPYYLRTGVASKKSDVYSFGVVVLELLTGTEAFCPSTERMLTPMVRPVLKQLAEADTARERHTATVADLVRELVDKRLGAGEYDPAEATAMAGLALGCLREQPSMRPSMTDVLTTMRDRVPSAFSAHEQNRGSRKFNSK